MMRLVLAIGAALGAALLASRVAGAAEPPPPLDRNPNDPIRSRYYVLRDPKGRYGFVVSASQPALAAAIVPSTAELAAMNALAAAVLDPLADALGKAPWINSGLRDEHLNKALDGASSSQHMTGQAVDLEPPDGMTAADLLELLEEMPGMRWDQAIVYAPSQGGHLHVSYKAAGRNRMETLVKLDTGKFVSVKSAGDARTRLAA